jgi:hypothetical protein
MRDIVHVMASNERLGEGFQLETFEPIHLIGMLLLHPRKIECAVIYVTGGEAELLGGIAHQDLERVVYRGSWLVCFDYVFALVCG